jgi:hypothetical protein
MMICLNIGVVVGNLAALSQEVEVINSAFPPHSTLRPEEKVQAGKYVEIIATTLHDCSALYMPPWLSLEYASFGVVAELLVSSGPRSRLLKATPSPIQKWIKARRRLSQRRMPSRRASAACSRARLRNRSQRQLLQRCGKPRLAPVRIKEGSVEANPAVIGLI